MEYVIRRRGNGPVLWAGAAESFAEAVRAAVRAGTDLAGADLAGSSLSRADLAGADLAGADLTRTALYRAELSLADLTGADLGGAILTGANLYWVCLSRADLSRADLGGADLAGANLCRANLSGANLCCANLSGVDLSWSDLSRSDLSSANLYWANLSRADLSGARLNWNSNDVVAELLRRAAGRSPGKRRLAGLVLVSRDWCWGRFLRLARPGARAWALGVLAPYVREGDRAPAALRRAALALQGGGPPSPTGGDESLRTEN